jgi:hypothetical protein
VTNLAEIVSRLEESGGRLVLDGDRIRYSVPSEDADARALLAELRKHRENVRAFLRARAAIPAMWPGVRLVAWELKEPPVAIEYHAVVTDPGKFARATLEELRERLTNPKRRYGWPIPQLIDRLAQVGVRIEIAKLDAPMLLNSTEGSGINVPDGKDQRIIGRTELLTKVDVSEKERGAENGTS